MIRILTEDQYLEQNSIHDNLTSREKKIQRFLSFCLIAIAILAFACLEIIELYFNFTKTDFEQNDFKFKDYFPIDYTHSDQNSLNHKIIQLAQEMIEPNTYIEIDKYAPFEELPICVLINNTGNSNFKKLFRSVQKQKYSNYQLILLDHNEGLNKISSYQIQYIKRHTYENYNSIISRQCKQKSLIFFPKSPLHNTALKKLNQLYQRKNVWMTFSLVGSRIEISSFFDRMYHLIELNDFEFQNTNLFGKVQKKHQIMALIQMGKLHSQRLTPQFLYYQNTQNFGLLEDDFQGPDKLINRKAYQPLLSLRQDYKIDFDYSYSSMIAQKVVNDLQLQKGIQKIELIFLPNEHSVAKKQKVDATIKYKLDKVNTELPICITMLSHNNFQNYRCIKVLESILTQQYSNYKIVFIDDMSDDQNMAATKAYLEKKKFPRDRIKYVQNFDTNGATYNYINSAHNYCSIDDLFLPIDGDDEFMGKQTFKIINHHFLNQTIWALWSKSVTNFYQYGPSKPFKFKTQILFVQKNTRRRNHVVGALRCYYVRLLRRIKFEDHHADDGSWLDTLSDDAIQHPLLEMSTPKHTLFLNQIAYFRNKGYGDNDDSSTDKLRHRQAIYFQIADRKPYKQLKTVSEPFTNYRVLFELEKDRGFKYITLTQSNQNLVRLQVNKKLAMNPQSSQVNKKIYSDEMKSLSISLTKKMDIPYNRDFNIFNELIKNDIEYFTKQLNFSQNSINEKDINKQLWSLNQIRAENQTEKKIFTAINMERDSFNASFLKLEYEILNKQYHFEQYEKQIPICVVSYGRNFQQYYQEQLASIFSQNYTNYNLIYISDDTFDKSNEGLKDYINSLPKQFSNKIKFIKNSQRLFQFLARKKAISEQCQNGSIIVDVNTESQIIGKQVFKVINAIFQQNTDLWMLSSDYIMKKLNIYTKSNLIFKQQVPKRVNFELPQYFRVFKKQLILKIQESQFKYDNQRPLEYYNELFYEFALLQMACPLHCRNIDNIFLLRNEEFKKQSQNKARNEMIKKLFQYSTSYNPLSSLDKQSSRDSLDPENFLIHSLRQLLEKKGSLPEKQQKIEGQQVCLFTQNKDEDLIYQILQGNPQLRIVNFPQNPKLQNFGYFDNYRFVYNNGSYYSISKIASENCPLNSIIVFTPYPFENSKVLQILQKSFSQYDPDVIYDCNEKYSICTIHAVKSNILQQYKQLKIEYGSKEAFTLLKKEEKLLKISLQSLDHAYQNRYSIFSTKYSSLKLFESLSS